MPTRPNAFALAVGTLALGLHACDAARPITDAGTGAGACAACHGDASRAEAVALVQAAPPAQVGGGGSGGAHLAHLHGGTFRGALACAECHAVPTVVTHSDGVVSVPLAGLASLGGATPAWNPGSGTCSGVYCHGATLEGGPATTPVWTATVTLSCTSCHGHPPASHAAGSDDCSVCHPGTVKPDGTIALANGLHVNGVVDGGGHDAGWADPAQHGYAANASGFAECKTCHGADLAGGSSAPSCTACHASAGFPAWATTCTYCHGNPVSGRASPPVDTQGRSAASNVSVGVHASHVATTIAAPIACTECHPNRAGSNVVTDAAHVDGDGIAEVAFGALARTGTAPAAYTRTSATAATCASTYCHGRFTGGANATMSWTSSTQVTCSSCHGNPPSSGRHDTHVNGEGYGCGTCHSGYTSSAANAALHVNGAKDVQLVAGTWSSSARSCSSTGCHGTRTW